MQFQIHKIICNDNCRNGITADKKQTCTHVTDNDFASLAAEFIAFERTQKSPSELFKALELWVDNPEFWAHCLSIEAKLHRHVPQWVRAHFLTLAQTQLRHLSHGKLRRPLADVFKRRARQLLDVCDIDGQVEMREEIRYLACKQLQFSADDKLMMLL